MPAQGWDDQSFHGLLEAAPDAMVIVDREGRIVRVNSHTEALFGYGAGELIGSPVELLVPAAQRQSHSERRDRYQEEPHRRPMGSGLELSGRRKDGTHFPVEISLSPVAGVDGPLVMAAVRDNTTKASVERALKAANKELEAFTYSVSHDLRAPIRQIDGFSQLLAEHSGASLDDKGRHYLRRIQEGAQSMGRLVDDLLNLARIGQEDFRPVLVSLESLVSDVVGGMEAEIGTRHVDWKLGPLPRVVGDPGLLRIALTNLLSNALKYTRPRERAVIEVALDGPDTIMVRDNGVGFDPKYADKLFGVFQRLHRAEEFEGQGVGLAIVQRIVHKHGGEIWADASPEAGAAFYVSLPRIEGSVEET
ncbi:MAG: PAS domain S-box protein [Gemmatimonadales bacterium]